MKDIRTYIKENLDEENLIWKIETYFKRKPEQYKAFTNIVKKCKQDVTVTKEKVEEYFKDTNIKIKPFVDFLDEEINVENDINKDYYYCLKKVIETILNNKSIDIEQM